MISKKECEKIIGHTIRNDTYQFISRMYNEETYEEIYKDLNKNRNKYNINETCSLTSKGTCDTYLDKIKEEEKKKINKKRKKRKVKEKTLEQKTGIYGIYIENDLVYIGKTMRGFKTRFNEHRNNYLTEGQYIYSLLREAKKQNKEIIMRPLVVLEDLEIQNSHFNFNNRDLSNMELALITFFQPKGNIEGRLKPYHFQED